MALKLGVTLKNAIINDFINKMAGTTGTGGTASMKIYEGAQPASPETEPGGEDVFLCEIINIAWDISTAGTAALCTTAGYTGTAYTSGYAGWARLERVGTDGTYRVDGNVSTSGTSGSPGNYVTTPFVIDYTAIVKGEPVTLVSAALVFAAAAVPPS